MLSIQNIEYFCAQDNTPGDPNIIIIVLETSK